MLLQPHISGNMTANKIYIHFDATLEDCRFEVTKFIVLKNLRQSYSSLFASLPIYINTSLSCTTSVCATHTKAYLKTLINPVNFSYILRMLISINYTLQYEHTKLS